MPWSVQAGYLLGLRLTARGSMRWGRSGTCHEAIHSSSNWYTSGPDVFRENHR